MQQRFTIVSVLTSAASGAFHLFVHGAHTGIIDRIELGDALVIVDSFLVDLGD